MKTSTDPTGRTITIRYDGLGRKVHIDDPDAGATDFSYNGLGELVSKTTPEGKTISIGHDSLSRPVWVSDSDLPRSVTVSGAATDFRYGPGRRRVEKTGLNGRTVYVGGLYEKRETPDATEHVFFVPGDGGIAAQVTRTVTGSVVTEGIVYFTRDHLGSSSAAFDQNGDAEVQVFDPWGERIYHGGAGGALMSAVHHGYTDQRHEDDLGWIDMNARMYDPTQRRFISADPLVADPLFSTGRNRFAYVLNNPLRYTDPTGLSGVVTQHNTWDHNAVRNDTTGATIKSSASFPDDSVSVPYGLNLPGYTWPVFQPAPFEQAPAEARPSSGPTGAESSTEVRHRTVVSPDNAVLDMAYARNNWAKDFMIVDPDSVNSRGRANYDCESPTNCKSIAADYIELPIGTSDVEVFLAVGGTGKILGGAWRGLAKLLQRSAPVVGPVLEAEVTAGALATEPTVGAGAAGSGPALPSLCFAEGTKVLMADESTKMIEEIIEGDIILADDPGDARAAEPRVVMGVHRTATYRLFHVEIGDEDGGEIVATGGHPFWTQRGWVAAEELKNNDNLADDVGRSVSIRAIAAESRDAPTFNLSIEGTHTFFVVAGSTPVLVHNVDPYDVLFSQSNHGRTFAEGPLAGKSLVDVAAEARLLGRLPQGLTLNVIEVNDQWVALNNRTLAVARMANLPEVAINDVGPSGMNKLQQLLRGSELVSPVENAVMRCK